MKASLGCLARLSAVLVLTGSIAAVPAVASSISITNPSFETVANVSGCSSSNTLVSGEFISTDFLGSGCQYSDPFNGTWTVSGDVGVWYPGASSYYPSGAPDGTNIAFANNGSISQTLSSATAQLGTYTLTVDIGGRCGTAPINNYTVELFAGSNMIASDSSNSLVPSLTGSGCGNFLLDTLTGNVTGSLVGEPLKIVLSATGSGDTTQAAFDDVTLNFQSAATVPEPSSALLLSINLLGAALIGLGWKLRKSGASSPRATTVA